MSSSSYSHTVTKRDAFGSQVKASGGRTGSESSNVWTLKDLNNCPPPTKRPKVNAATASKSTNSILKPNIWTFKDFDIPQPERTEGTASNKTTQKPSSSNANNAIVPMYAVVDDSWELLDPNPDVHALFVAFRRDFFYDTLGGVEVKWSKRMTSCAGVCQFSPRGRQCIISLSEPLLSLRPRKDLVETLLHEMIHAYLFLYDGRRDREAHGPLFLEHMNRINGLTGAKISVYHSFHDEVNHFQTHWWRCTGPCKDRKPYFGFVKRSMNRAPGPSDFWFKSHQESCTGSFVKIREPPKKEVVKKASVLTKKDTPSATVAEGMKRLFGGISRKVVETVTKTDNGKKDEDWYWQDYTQFEEFSANKTQLSDVADSKARKVLLGAHGRKAETTETKTDKVKKDEDWYWQDYTQYEEFSSNKTQLSDAADSKAKKELLGAHGRNLEATEATCIKDNKDEDWYWQDHTQFEEYSANTISGCTDSDDIEVLFEQTNTKRH